MAHSSFDFGGAGGKVAGMTRHSLRFLPLLTALSLVFFASARADDDGAGRPGGTFGPYRALTLNQSILRDVKVDKEGSVFLQLYPEHKDKEIVVKISNEKFDSYRKWWHGGYELVSPAKAEKPPYGWTDWVQTKAKYIEYWMDGEVFLHLARIDGN